MAKHLLASLSFVIFSVSLSQSQEVSNDLFREKTHANAFEEKNAFIPVSKGDKVILQIDRLFQPPVKQPVLANFIKGAGIAAMTYQSGNLLNSSKSKESKQTNWLIPLGATLTVSANKISQRRNQVYVRYSVFNSNKEELFFDVIKVDKKMTKTGDEYVKIVESDGFIKVEVFKSGIEYSSSEIIEVLRHKTANEDMEIPTLRYPYSRGDVVNISYERPEQRNSVIIKKIQGEAVNLLPTIFPKIEKNNSKVHSSIKFRNNRTNHVTKANNKNNVNGIDEMAIYPVESAAPKTTSSPKNKKSNSTKSISQFTWTNRRRIGKKSDDVIDDNDDNGNNFPPIAIKNSTHVPGVGGFGYGTGGDAIVYNTPRYASSQTWYNYGGTGGGGWDDSGNYYDAYDPCDTYNYVGCEEDFCIVNPTDPICCDQEDPNSPCYVPCPTGQAPNGSMLVDFNAFNRYLTNVIPPGIKTDTLYLSMTTDSWGITNFQLSGAYSDANGNVTTFSKFKIGDPIPNPAVWGDVMRQDTAFITYGDPISYVGGTVQNYYDPNSGSHYALWTDSQAPYAETVFPNTIVKDDAVTDGAAYTIPNPASIWYPQSIVHMSTSGNGLSTLQHEFGHYLQMLVFGVDFYLYSIVPTSLYSATVNPSKHTSKWTETSASAFSKFYFGPNSAIGQSTFFKSTICE